MNSVKANTKTDFSVIIKLIITLSVLLLTLRFAKPFSLFISEGSESFLGNNSLIAEYLSCQETSEEQKEKPSSDEAEKKSEDVSDNTEALFYETPADVIEMENEYLACFADKEASGQVEEVFFRSSGSTHSADGIYIKNTTASKNPDFSSLINEGPTLEIADISQPTVLIFHTHTTESYLMSDTGSFYDGFETRSTESSRNMVRVGEEICRVLESCGIGYIHDKSIYDESYNGAYARSRISVEEYLRKYPTIKIVIDVHRDAIHYSDTSHCKPTAEINGRKAAQIMIITGAEEGYITDFPYWEDNLKFALCFQKTAEEKYPGLMKPLYFCQRKYNMDTAKCSVLLEIGTDANTLDEALYSAFMTGEILSEIINRYKGFAE